MAIGKYPSELLVNGKFYENQESKCINIILSLPEMFIRKEYLDITRAPQSQVYDHEVSTVVVLDSPRIGTKYPAFWPPEIGIFHSDISIHVFQYVPLIVWLKDYYIGCPNISGKPKKYGPVPFI